MNELNVAFIIAGREIQTISSMIRENDETKAVKHPELLLDLILIPFPSGRLGHTLLATGSRVFRRATPVETPLFLIPTAQSMQLWIHPFLPKASSMMAWSCWTSSSDGVL